MHLPRTLSAVSFGLVLCALSNTRASAAKLRDVIYKVETQYDDRTRDMLLEWSKVMRQLGSQDGARMFESLAHNGGGGTGWLYRDHSQPYVITNAHVVAGASSVTLYKRDASERFRRIDNCEIAFVDFDHDLAVVVPPSNYQMPERGLEMAHQDLHTDKTVFAAGFPGDSGEQGWTFARGAVVNPHVTSLQAFGSEKRRFEFLIEHSAAINHGSSGSPLLVAKHYNTNGEVDEDDASNFQVVGVNVAIAGKFNFSIPVTNVHSLIREAKRASAVMSDVGSRARALEEEAKTLAAELGRVRTSEEDINEAIDRLPSFMSNAYAGRYGNATFVTVLKETQDEKRREALLTDFLQDPVAALDKAARVHFVMKLVTLGDLSDIRFGELNFADRRDLMHRTEVSTSFVINNRKQDVTWKIEYGRWRVCDLKLVSEGESNEGRDNVNRSPEEPDAPSPRVTSWMNQLRQVTGRPR